MARADFALLCEDVRQEVNGKQILIGVFTGDVLVERFPLNMQPVFWVSLCDMEAGELSMKMRVHDGKGAIFGTIEGGLTVHSPPPRSAPFAAPPIPVIYSSAGELVLSVQINDGQWTDLLTKNVMLKPRGGSRQSLAPATPTQPPT